MKSLCFLVLEDFTITFYRLNSIDCEISRQFQLYILPSRRKCFHSWLFVSWLVCQPPNLNGGRVSAQRRPCYLYQIKGQIQETSHFLKHCETFSTFLSIPQGAMHGSRLKNQLFLGFWYLWVSIKGNCLTFVCALVVPQLFISSDTLLPAALRCGKWGCCRG